MTLRKQLILSIVGAVLATTALEAAAAHTINLKLAAFGARGWLEGASREGVTAVIRSEQQQLEAAARILPATFDDGEAAGLAFYDADDGRFWRIIDASGREARRSPGACEALPPKLADGPAPVDGAVLCGRTPTLVVSARLATGQWLVLGRYFDQRFVDALAHASAAEVALWSPDGVIGTTTHDAAGAAAPLSYSDGLESRVLEMPSGLVANTLTVGEPGYSGYSRGGELVAAGAPTLEAYSFVAPLPGAEQLPVRLMLWIPASLLTDAGPFSALVNLGSALVLPFLIVIAWIVATRIARPIAALAAAARRVTEGDMEARAPQNIGGEVGELARAFDAMVVGLREAQARGVVSEKMAAIGQLAGGVAHEINNPLGVILGFAQGLERRVPEGDPLRMPVEAIVREALRCRALVQELLVFSRHNKKAREEVDVAALARATAPLLESRGRTQNVELVCDVEDTGCTMANRTQLQQVLVNLGTNALDAMEHGGGTLTIRVRREGDRIRLEVGDTGTGIDPGIRTRIFDPFFTTKDVGKGTGLGLSLVHEIVKQHCGTIEVGSAEPRGTTMRVRIPLVAVTAPEASPASSPSPPSPPSPAARNEAA